MQSDDQENTSASGHYQHAVNSDWPAQLEQSDTPLGLAARQHSHPHPNHQQQQRRPQQQRQYGEPRAGVLLLHKGGYSFPAPASIHSSNC
jgi:hypothetical protein